MDFKRFVKSYYDKPLSDGGPSRSAELDQIGPTFYEKVWQWVISHTDVRITHKGVTCRYTLAEFEAAETSEQNATDVTAAKAIKPKATVDQTAGHAESLLALRDSLRQRLKKEGHQLRATDLLRQDTRTAESKAQTTAIVPINRAPRVAPTTTGDGDTIFDDVPKPDCTSSLCEPRSYLARIDRARYRSQEGPNDGVCFAFTHRLARGGWCHAARSDYYERAR